MSTYTTAGEMDDAGRYAWPGGYPVAYFFTDRWNTSGGSVLCFDCARANLADAVNEDNETRRDGAGMLNNASVDAWVCQGGEGAYGGLMCDGCDAWIVEPTCPECSDELGDKPRLYADDVDASQLCMRCAAKMVIQAYDDAASDEDMAACLPDYHDSHYRAVSTNPRAKRLPGIGIQLIDSEYGSAWYAPAGTIYRYANR